MTNITDAQLLTIFDGVVSHALALGRFDRVNGHEPKSAPPSGLTAAVWVDRIAPVPAMSGMASTTGVLVLNARIYTTMLSEPQDAIDPAVLAAVVDLMGAYSGDFDLGGSVRNVDLLGQSGFALSAQAGYLNQDNKIFRVMTITLPLIVNDLWDQVA
jgi:hypothetical protein